MENTPVNNTQNFQKTALIWGMVAIALSFIMLVFNNSPLVLAAGFFTKAFAFFVGAICGLVGALIGEALRQFALPDGFFTSGGMGSLLKTRLFWAIGPQAIGTFIGVALGIAIVLQ